MGDNTLSQVVNAVLIAGVGLLLALLIGLRKVIVSYLDRWVKRLDERSEYSLRLHILAEFLFCFEAIGQLEFVERFMLIEGKDSGGMPEPGKPYTIRCVRGQARVKGKQSPYDLYSSPISVDGHYCEMLHQMVGNENLVLKADEMPKTALLTHWYKAEGVHTAYLAYLGVADATLLFVSYAKYTGDFTEEELTALGLGVNRLRGKFRAKG